ncbi:hypothetical protein COT87_03190 [Candidatus Collierbacteria bacterium CG10_big_fil_rev_8_21_14_0_10_44_9]|uniref:Uracil phosphoribosyltransferase n=1 Tax=Candidatus Collierbacteria bacterium CG10_big_fil_rev_8_21_14_0_10_44_9 TaxID=1974535 RepID=A0A2H0VI14_9BACT|nr:MAG: hypothetical protein COT87_03190 [Candidatus Collierbacteria bacterium CG10_big_fil_rev_8_21_14_0_10_44_9]
MAKIYDEFDLLSHAKSDPSLIVTIVDHPLVRAKLAIIRNQGTTQVEFRTAAVVDDHLNMVSVRNC